MKPLSFLIILALSAPLQATETVTEIVEKANRASYYAGRDGRANVHMTLKDARGGIRERSFTILRHNGENGDQKFYVYFKEPSDVRQMAYLVWKNADGVDDRWLWLPALNLVKRIAPGDKRTSFVGSDFLYEDVSGRGVHEDKHELLSQTQDTFFLKSTPVDPASVEFSYYTLEIDKATYLPKKAVYYDKAGLKYREVEALEVATIDGFPTVVTSVARDLKAKTETVNRFSDVVYNVGLDERIFSERFLRRPPREAVK